MNKQKKCLLIINSTAKLDFKKSEFLVQKFFTAPNETNIQT